MTGAATTYTSDAQHRVTQVASAEHPADPFVSHGYDDQDRVVVQYGSVDTTLLLASWNLADALGLR